ncbi:hypothetical protein [Rubritalea tangerina]|uniref:Uncharacterized protein n=1 Tax=Rubritalea tangerina TaxID=430798 RepID=A0ABW4Z7E0_9BACT
MTDKDKEPVWDLLDNASTQKADPMFAKNVMRSIRLEETPATPWWKKCLSPAPVVGTLATAAACVALILTQQSSTPEKSPETLVATSTEDSFEEVTASYSASEDFDDIISPISLIASNDTNSLSEIDLFLEL